MDANITISLEEFPDLGGTMSREIVGEVTPVPKIIVGESFTLSTSRSLQRRPYSLKTRKHSVFKNEGCRAFTRQPYLTEPDPILLYRILPDHAAKLPIPHQCVLHSTFAPAIELDC